MWRATDAFVLIGDTVCARMRAQIIVVCRPDQVGKPKRTAEKEHPVVAVVAAFIFLAGW